MSFCCFVQFCWPPFFIGCVNLLWIIIGPIMLTSLAKTTKEAEANNSIVQQFEIVNECADPRAFVDISGIMLENNDQLHIAKVTMSLGIAVFAF